MNSSKILLIGLLFFCFHGFQFTHAQSLILLEEGFEDAYNFPPEGWQTIDLNGDGNNWQRSPVGNWNTHSGGGCATSASHNSATGEGLNPHNYLITPSIEIPDEGYMLEYYVAGQDNIFSAEHYKVVVSETGSNPDDFNTILYEETLPSNAQGAYYERTVSLDDFAGKSIYIAFVHYNTSNQFFLNLDDISVYISFDINAKIKDIIEPVGTCELPDSIYPVVEIVNNGLNSFDYFYLSYTFLGDTITELVEHEVLPSESFIYSFQTGVNLSSSGKYTLGAFIDVPGDDYADDDYTEKQISLGPDRVPYAIHFEEGEDSSFWRVVDVNGDGRTWNWVSTGGNYGQGCLRYDYSFSEQAFDAFLSKCIELEKDHNYRLSFYYKGGSTFFEEKLKVYINYSQSYSDTVKQLAYLDEIKNVTYNRHELIFSVPQDSVYYLNFIARSLPDNLFLFIDDIVLEQVFDYDAGISAIKPDYYLLPKTQTRDIDFNAEVSNLGQSTLNDIKVSYSVNEDYWTSESMISMLEPDQKEKVITNEAFLPESIGQYNVVMEVSSEEEDEYPQNNIDSIEFHITDTVMARENGVNTGGLGIGNRGILGHYFEIERPDTLTSVSFFLRGPVQGDSVKVSIFSFDQIPQNILRQTEQIKIESSDPMWYTLPIEGGYLPLEPGKIFIGVHEFHANVSLGTNPTFHKDSVSFIRIGSAAWQTNEALGHPVTYMLRANFGSFTLRPNYKAEITEILEPVNDCYYDEPKQVSIRFQNKGALAISNLKIICECETQTLEATINENIEAWGISEHTFSEMLYFDSPGTYDIVCSIELLDDEDNFTSSTTKSVEIGPQFVPYFCGFEPDEDISGWLVEDANFDNFTWDLEYNSPLIANTGENAAIYQYNISGVEPADDWLYSKCLFLEEGKSYNIEFYYKTGEHNGINYTEKLKIHLLDSTFSSFANSSNLIHDFYEISNNNHRKFEKEITVESTGTYYLAWHVYSDPDQFYLAIDDFFIDEVPYYENSVNNYCKEHGVSIYPNPFVSNIYIDIPKENFSDNYIIEVFDLTGKKLFADKFNIYKKEINLKHLDAGMYILKIQNKDKSETAF